MLKPARPGTGVIAGGSVRIILESAGLKNVVAKSLGSSNSINAAHATLDALRRLKKLDEEVIKRGKKLPVFIAHTPTETIESSAADTAEKPAEEAKTEKKAKAAKEPKAETKPAKKAEPKAKAKPAAKTEAKAEPKVAAKAEAASAEAETGNADSAEKAEESNNET